jgi:hypothetical protein
MSQIGDDRSTLTGIPANEVVIHGHLDSHISDGFRLLDIDVHWRALVSINSGSSGFGSRALR